jgi:hypothetical protein
VNGFHQLSHVSKSSVVVDDFNIKSISIFPAKTDTPLVIDPDTMLPSSVASESFQPIPRGAPQVTQIDSAIQVEQLASRHTLDVPKPSHVTVIKQCLRISAAK